MGAMFRPRCGNSPGAWLPESPRKGVAPLGSTPPPPPSPVASRGASASVGSHQDHRAQRLIRTRGDSTLGRPIPRSLLQHWPGVSVFGALLLLAAPARAEWAALSSDACGAGVLAKAFSCDSNTGQDWLVVSALRDSAERSLSGSPAWSRSFSMTPASRRGGAPPSANAEAVSWRRPQSHSPRMLRAMMKGTSPLVSCPTPMDRPRID